MSPLKHIVTANFGYKMWIRHYNVELSTDRGPVHKMLNYTQNAVLIRELQDTRKNCPTIWKERSNCTELDSLELKSKGKKSFMSK